MKIFIWEHVLTDYTDGLAFAYAETLEEALSTFVEPYVASELGQPTSIIDCDSDRSPKGFYVYGGG